MPKDEPHTDLQGKFPVHFNTFVYLLRSYNTVLPDGEV